MSLSAGVSNFRHAVEAVSRVRAYRHRSLSSLERLADDRVSRFNIGRSFRCLCLAAGGTDHGRAPNSLGRHNSPTPCGWIQRSSSHLSSDVSRSLPGSSFASHGAQQITPPRVLAEATPVARNTDQGGAVGMGAIGYARHVGPSGFLSREHLVLRQPMRLSRLG